MSAIQAKIHALRAQIEDLQVELDALESKRNAALMGAARRRHRRLMQTDALYRAQASALEKLETGIYTSTSGTLTFTGLNAKISKAKPPKTRTKKPRGKK